MSPGSGTLINMSDKLKNHLRDLMKLHSENAFAGEVFDLPSSRLRPKHQKITKLLRNEFTLKELEEFPSVHFDMHSRVYRQFLIVVLSKVVASVIDDLENILVLRRNKVPDMLFSAYLYKRDCNFKACSDQSHVLQLILATLAILLEVEKSVAGDDVSYFDEIENFISELS